ncbi:MAG: carbon-nitrogen family hydrolase [Methylococcales bacterium]|nr:carbon-nitrogen family hydrolase [Methylococcales bacterium]
MKIHCFQTDTVWEDPAANFGRIELLVANEKSIGPDSLLVFPELSTFGFSMDVEAGAEPRDGESFQFFSALAKKYNCHVLAGLLGKDEESGLGLNEAVCFAPDGEEISRYRKVHPLPLAGEGDHYLAGTEAVVFEIRGWKVSPTICYDLRFPELFRSAAKQGAELFVVIANWPNVREDHWVTLLRARAIENQAYVAGVNRCGSDPTLNYSGVSLLIDPLGEILAQTGAEPEVICSALDKNFLNNWREQFPAIDDMKLV